MEPRNVWLRQAARLLALGPAVVVSVAYIDPGNFGTNIVAGSSYGLRLLWVVWVSGLMAILFQYISGKAGLAGVTVPDYVFARLRSRDGSGILAALYFAALFIMVIATDMAEFLGIALGLHLLLGIPLVVAAWFSVIDVLLLMVFAESASRLETVIALLVSVVGLSFVYELGIVGVNVWDVAVNSLRIDLSAPGMALVASGIIGATVMPHAVLLHSYLARDKWGRERGGGLAQALRKHAVETLFYLSAASVINAAIQVMSYYAFYRNGYRGLDSVDRAYEILTPLYGQAASLVFGVAILASGLSSSMVSVMAGVKIIESYVRRPVKGWKVRMTARLINMIPLTIAVHAGVNPLDVLVYSQAVLSATLPLVLIPLIAATSDRRLLGSLANSRVTTLLAAASTAVIITVNLQLALK